MAAFICTMTYTAQLGLFIRFAVIIHNHKGSQLFVKAISLALLLANTADLISVLIASNEVSCGSYVSDNTSDRTA